MTETGGSTLGGVTVADGGPTAGLVVCADEVLGAGEVDVGDVIEPVIGTGEVDVGGGVTEPVIGTGEEDVGGGADDVVGGGVTDPVIGVTQVKVGKKRPIASVPLKCTSAWTKHLPGTLAKSGTDSLVGPFGPIEKSRLS